MGYKSVLRSMNAASNRYEREKQREQNQLHRAYERHAKKIMQLEDKKNKIMAELTKVYASGKMTPDKYDELIERENYISLDLIAVGGSPFVTLAKRYVSGKIDQDEFERISKHILPSDFVREKEFINIKFEEKQSQLTEFMNSCKIDEGCQYCGKKGFFAFIKKYKGLHICSKHIKELDNICVFKHSGYYFTVEPIDIMQEVKENFCLPITFNSNVL